LLGLVLDAPEDSGADIRDVLTNINAIVSMDIGFETITRFDGLMHLVEVWPYPTAAEGSMISLLELRERQQIVMTYVLQKDYEHVQLLFDAFLAILPPEDQRSASIDFFAGLVERLRMDNRPHTQVAIFPYARLAEAKTPEALRAGGQILIRELILRAYTQKSLNKTTLIEKACAYIDGNYNHNITLEQVAAGLFISPAYLSRLFKEITGGSFKSYLIDRRLAQACALLGDAHNHAKVYEICSAIGYSDVNYFYQIFTKKMGCAPMEYRARRLTEDGGTAENSTLSSRA
jgi:AraC-like DNA-binding protein